MDLEPFAASYCRAFGAHTLPIPDAGVSKRPEGPEVARPGRKAGMAGWGKVSAEGAVQGRFERP